MTEVENSALTRSSVSMYGGKCKKIWSLNYCKLLLVTWKHFSLPENPSVCLC